MSLIGIIASSKARGLPVSGASLWLDASDATTFTFSSGTRVSQWNDKSGNAYNFTQATGANQPDRSGTQNSLNIVKMKVSSAVYFMKNTSLGDWSASAFTVFVVFDLNGGTYPAIIGRNDVASLQMGANVNGGTIAISRIGQATTQSNVDPTGGADLVVYKSAGVSSSSITVTPYLNGTTGNTMTIGITAAGTSNVIGASGDGTADSFGNDGYIAELILYPSQLNDTDRGSVQTYLKNKWGTP